MASISDVSQDSLSAYSKVSEESRVRKFVKHMLRNSLFMGSFIEKRFVEPLNAYRDIVKINDDETDFIDNLLAARKRLVKYYPTNHWVGITDPKTIGAPAGWNLWVSLDEEYEEVFGSYWYKVKNIQFCANEVKLKLKVLRPLPQECTPVQNISSQKDIPISDEFTNNITFVAEVLTLSNVKEALIFSFLLISTVLALFMHGIKFFLEYFLKLVQELNNMIQVCTPIIIGLLKLISNIVYGFYALIMAMWRSRSPPKVEQVVYQIRSKDMHYMYRNMDRLPYNNYYYPKNRYLPIKNSSVVITPIDD